LSLHPERLALFDLDGTLTDPAAGITQSLRRGLKAVDLDADQFLPLEQFIGPPLQESFASMGVGPTDIATAIGGFREYYGSTGIFENEVYEGTDAMLTRLTDAGWTLAVATSKPEPFAIRILDHFNLSDHFSAVVGATLDGTRRHKIDVIAHALSQMSWQPGATSQAVMVGDRDVDIRGGQAHGLATIGVVWGYGTVEELIEAETSALAATPDDIATVLGVDARE